MTVTVTDDSVISCQLNASNLSPLYVAFQEFFADGRAKMSNSPCETSIWSSKSH